MANESNIIERRTLEQFAADTKSGKLNIHPASVGKGAEKKPLCFEGTNIRKHALVNEAGDTLGWLSKGLCQDIMDGKFDKTRELVVLKSEAPDRNDATKMVTFTTLSYAATQSEDFSVDSLYKG